MDLVAKIKASARTASSGHCRENLAPRLSCLREAAHLAGPVADYPHLLIFVTPPPSAWPGMTVCAAGCPEATSVSGPLA